MYEFIAVQRDAAVTIVTLNRPEVHNALHTPAHLELERAFDDFADDPGQRVAILAAAGNRSFCAGQDVKHSVPPGEPMLPPSGFGGLTARFGLNKPIIAAVEGTALGGGFELALACDLVVASRHAMFGLPEPRVGLAAFGGGLLRLPRQIALKHAMGMILTGRRVGAADGCAMGFVNEVVDPGEVLSTCRRWAAQIMECSPHAIGASMEVAYQSLKHASLEAAHKLQMGYPSVGALARSGDVQEGAEAFAQRRPPRWNS